MSSSTTPSPSTSLWTDPRTPKSHHRSVSCLKHDPELPTHPPVVHLSHPLSGMVPESFANNLPSLIILSRRPCLQVFLSQYWTRPDHYDPWVVLPPFFSLTDGPYSSRPCRSGFSFRRVTQDFLPPFLIPSCKGGLPPCHTHFGVFSKQFKVRLYRYGIYTVFMKETCFLHKIYDPGVVTWSVSGSRAPVRHLFVCSFTTYVTQSSTSFYSADATEYGY